ncbi:GNAT family N-acetyltransferase [Brevundimonas sp.]|uniref:GNAT family N-acetyltransferase n=1 Tax=Brevundimonas sp. TaxID=1871086 RepID=UPI002D755E3E|nr:GNAT family N-acetyltransferase [Brevundimonas sp.]HYC75639.1 GNAT family N-acetyltransferase [Brevundimonas sp.]
MASFTRIDFRTSDALSVNDPAARRSLLLEGESLHRQLRPALEADYPAQIERLFGEGARLAQLVDEGEVRAIGLWRVFETTYCGRRLEIEDLVSSEAHRSRGYGAALLRWFDARAVALGCPTTTLHSGVHRDRAHRFYFREGFHILAFHFSRPSGAR